MKKIAIVIIIILTSCAAPKKCCAQDHVFTEEEVIKIEINLLNKQLFNYRNLHQQDSLHLIYLEQNIVLLNERIDLYIDLTKELEPKWYKKPTIHFLLGAATIVTSSWVVSNIK